MFIIVMIGKSGVGDAVDSHNLNSSFFESKGVTVLGAIFNKLSSDLSEYYNIDSCALSVRSYFRQYKNYQRIYGFIPLVDLYVGTTVVPTSTSSVTQSTATAIVETSDSNVTNNTSKAKSDTTPADNTLEKSVAMETANTFPIAETTAVDMNIASSDENIKSSSSLALPIKMIEEALKVSGRGMNRIVNKFREHVDMINLVGDLWLHQVCFDLLLYFTLVLCVIISLLV